VVPPSSPRRDHLGPVVPLVPLCSPSPAGAGRPSGPPAEFRERSSPGPGPAGPAGPAGSGENEARTCRTRGRLGIARGVRTVSGCFFSPPTETSRPASCSRWRSGSSAIPSPRAAGVRHARPGGARAQRREEGCLRHCGRIRERRAVRSRGLAIGGRLAGQPGSRGRHLPPGSGRAGGPSPTSRPSSTWR
jgi:hypothetical protein